MERLFPADLMTRRERVEAALSCRPVDRVPILEQLSYNPRVIADWTGKPIRGFDYTVDDICQVIRLTCDMAMPPVAPRGTGRSVGPDGIVYQHDNWTSWRLTRPCSTPEEGRDWLRRRAEAMEQAPFDAAEARAAYRREMLDLQARIGDTVILKYHGMGLCSAYDSMGLELFAYVCTDYPEALEPYVAAAAETEIRRIHAVADPQLSPVILIADDFATKQGPIFAPDFLERYLFQYVRRAAAAWHEHGVKVLFHSDGNYRQTLPALIACGVDGFYCLEPGVGMDIVELKQTWPSIVWSGGVDGVDLLERGTPEQVRAEVRRHIIETDALHTGGMFVASSSEINPPIPPENFRAMVEAVGELTNPALA